MKLILCVFLILIISVFTAWSQPRIFSPVGKEINLGNVGSDSYQCRFPVMNSGKGILKVYDIIVSGSAIKAKIDKNEIQESDTAYVYLDLKLKGSEPGENNGFVIIKSNTYKDSDLTVSLKMNIVNDLQVTPKIIHVPLTAESGKEIIREAEIFNSSKEPIRIMQPAFSGSKLDIAFTIDKEITIKPGERFKLGMRLTPKDKYLIIRNVTIPTSSKYNPLIEIKFSVHDGPQ